MKIKRYALARQYQGLLSLSRIGSTDKATVKAVAKLMTQVAAASAEVENATNILVTGHAKKDEKGAVLTNDKGAIVFDSLPLFQLAVSDYTFEDIELDVTPLTVEQLDNFKEYPDSETLGNLGSLVAF